MLVASHILTFPLVPLLPETAQKDTKNDPSLAESCQACTFVCEHTGFLLGRSPQKGGFTPFWVSPGCAPGLPEVSPRNGGGAPPIGVSPSNEARKDPTFHLLGVHKFARARSKSSRDGPSPNFSQSEPVEADPFVRRDIFSSRGASQTEEISDPKIDGFR
jgi:hypothetical protein